MPEKLLDTNFGLSDSKLKLATATENDVLSGKTFYAENNILKTGSKIFGGIVDTIYYGYYQVGSTAAGPARFTLNHEYDYYIVCSLWWSDNSYPTIDVFSTFPHIQTMYEFPVSSGLTQTRRIDKSGNTLLVYPSSRSDGNGGLIRAIYGIRSN